MYRISKLFHLLCQVTTPLLLGILELNPDVILLLILRRWWCYTNLDFGFDFVVFGSSSKLNAVFFPI
jgi:hypothetical protein